MVKQTLKWCKHCQIPILDTEQTHCPLCNKKLVKTLADIKPVFPEERFLLEYLTGRECNSLKDDSIWCNNNTYIINNKKIRILNSELQTVNADDYLNYKNKHKLEIGCFNLVIERFVKANLAYLEKLTEEATDFIKSEAKNVDPEDMYVSFSGGKDSTVVADLVLRVFGKIKCAFADTTLEHPLTMEYVKRFKKQKGITLFTAKNEDRKFYDMAETLGPPARLLRWCCYMFKTGPINRLIKEKFKNAKLSFYGIRKNESVSRSKYNRSENNDANTKIANQTVASPIFEWKECDIWLYMLANKVDFNDAYKLGYKRVGCWCCPNCSNRSELMAKISIPNEFKKWHKFLLDFAIKTNKSNPEEYVDQGFWKARCGGNGLKSSSLVKINSDVCITDENSKIYFLDKDVNEAFMSLFIPFGKVIEGNKQLNEYLILDIRTLQPYIKITIQEKRKIKVSVLNVKSVKQLHRDIYHQIVKYNACQGCLKCEALCSAGAVSVRNNSYIIDDEKCLRCRKCVSARFLSGGCLMCRFLKTKKEAK